MSNRSSNRSSNSDALDPEVLGTHVRFNQISVDDSDCFANHRNNLMNLIGRIHARLSDSSSDATLGKIAVLGAGNCNDLDLPRLCELFQEVHLVDLDASAIKRAANKQTPELDRVHLHAPFDIAAPLASGHLSAELVKGSSVPVRECDIVVSSGLLSQLILTGHQLAERADTSKLEMVQWIRANHWKTVERMLRPGGSLLLTLDFVSSDSAPELLSVAPDQFNDVQLRSITKRLIQSGNFFTGLNPGMVLNEIQQLANVSLRETTVPWIWELGPRRFLVMGLVADFHVA